MISKLHLNLKPDPARYQDPEQPERSWGDERDAKNFRFGEKSGVFFLGGGGWLVTEPN